MGQIPIGFSWAETGIRVNMCKKVTSAVQIYRLIINAKSKVKRDNPAIASYPRESAKHLLFLGFPQATEEITGF